MILITFSRMNPPTEPGRTDALALFSKTHR